MHPASETAPGITPGPWHFGIGQVAGREHVCVAQTANQSNVIAITGYWPADDEAESTANAQLIAAAPELLAALRALLAEGLDNTPGTRQARAAVSLAIGAPA